MEFYYWADNVLQFSVPGKRLTDNLVHMDWRYQIAPCDRPAIAGTVG